MPSLEYNIMLAASQISPTAEQQDKLQHLISRQFNQELLMKLVFEEGMAGFLYKNLKKTAAIGHLDRRQIQSLQSKYYTTVRCNLRLIHDLKQILQRVNQTAIRMVLMQGIALLAQIYPDVGLRPLTDIDLWVLPEDCHELVNILTGLDFQKDPLYPLLFRKDSTLIDVHTHILWTERIRTRRFLLSKNQAAVYADTRLIDIDGQAARCLAPPDQALYLGLHALKHNVQRLIWLVDIKNLIALWKPQDWETYLNRARELGLEKSAMYTSFLLTDLFDLQLPRTAQKFLHGIQPNGVQKMLLRQRGKTGSLPPWASLMLVSPDRGLRQRLMFIFETLFPRPQVLRQVFATSPALKAWQLYCKRLMQLAGLIKP